MAIKITRPRTFTAKEFRNLLNLLKITGNVLADILCVHNDTIEIWRRQGVGAFGPTCRLLEAMSDDPEYWRNRYIKVVKVLPNTPEADAHLKVIDP